ncbi:MAG: hypothetical protein GXO08_01715 [Aquificae bacterium]|nr:hypothetical protein [Aquificota bacterium]
MGNLTEELLEDLYRRLADILGEKMVRLFKRKISQKQITRVPQIIFAVAGEMEKTLGRMGAYASLRELGRSVARDLMAQHPKEEWEKIFEEGLAIMGFAKGVQREPNRACICSCIFYPQFLSKKGLQPTEHPVCWIGWGFIEGFMKEFTGATGVRFAGRDFENERCWFEVVNY